LITRRHVGSRPRLLEFFCILGVRCRGINHGLSASGAVVALSSNKHVPIRSQVIFSTVSCRRNRAFA
jgi:hypothetical protein